MRVWDTATGKELATFGHTGEVWRAQFNLEGTRVITTSDKEPARLWDATTGNALTTLAGHTGAAWPTVFSPDGTSIFIASYDMTAGIWDIATGKVRVTFAGQTGAIFNVNGTRIITTEDIELTHYLWDATTGKMLATFDAKTISAEFSPDGGRIITASGGKVADVWNSATGRTLKKLAGHTGQVASAKFSRDGTRIVTTSLVDKTARVWDATTGELLATLETRYQEWMWHARFNSDGTCIVTTSDAGPVRVWDVLPKGAGSPPEWFPDFLRYMAQMRLNSNGELERLKLADWLALQERLRGVLRLSVGVETHYMRMLRKYVRE